MHDLSGSGEGTRKSGALEGAVVELEEQAVVGGGAGRGDGGP